MVNIIESVEPYTNFIFVILYNISFIVNCFIYIYFLLNLSLNIIIIENNININIIDNIVNILILKYKSTIVLNTQSI
jgi:hypothetical protein|nr:MAG TPA: hypothetical protein [Caudoviricetes sp.]